MKEKASYVIIEVLDERGRYIATDEFRWIMQSFRDRYDPRRLSFALSYTTGLRQHDCVYARVDWFSADFSEMKMAQCKPHFNKRDNILKARLKPKFVPLPDWLSEDIRNYVKYRLMVANYIGEGITDRRLFPSLKKHNLRQMFQKFRMRHSDKQKWLLDVWQILKVYNCEHKLIWQRNYYRVAGHAGRANYCTAAYEVANRDLQATKLLSGHSETKHLEKYIRVNSLQEMKQEIKERYMNPLIAQQNTPVMKGQKKLTEF